MGRVTHFNYIGTSIDKRKVLRKRRLQRDYEHVEGMGRNATEYTVRQKEVSETGGEGLQNSYQASNATRRRKIGYNEATRTTH